MGTQPLTVHIYFLLPSLLQKFPGRAGKPALCFSCIGDLMILLVSQFCYLPFILKYTNFPDIAHSAILKSQLPRNNFIVYGNMACYSNLYHTIHRTMRLKQIFQNICTCGVQDDASFHRFWYLFGTKLRFYSKGLIMLKLA